MQNKENSIPFVPVTIEDAAETASPAESSKRSFDLANEREKQFEEMVNQVSNFEELNDVINKLGDFVPTSHGPQPTLEVVALPVNEIRNFYISIKNDNQPRPDDVIIEDMLLRITRSYNLRNKVSELVAKELKELFQS